MKGIKEGENISSLLKMEHLEGYKQALNIKRGALLFKPDESDIDMRITTVDISFFPL